MNSAHTHGASHVSGVFYVDSGGGGGSSCTLLQNPAPGRHHAAAATENPLGGVGAGLGGGNDDDDICLAPVAGSVLLFPGWLPHAVLPHDGHEPRLTISFNADFEQLPTLRARTSPTGTSGSVRDPGYDDGESELADFNEAATDQDWLAAGRSLQFEEDGGGSSHGGTNKGWLRRAWSTTATVWTLPPVSTAVSAAVLAAAMAAVAAAEQGVMTEELPEPSVAALTAVSRDWVCSLLAAASNGRPCNAWVLADYELLRLSPGAGIDFGLSSPSSILTGGQGTAAAGDGDGDGDATDGDDNDDDDDCDTLTDICGVVQFDVGSMSAGEATTDEGEKAATAAAAAASAANAERQGGLVLSAAEPRPEYGFEMSASDDGNSDDTRFLHIVGLLSRQSPRQDTVRMRRGEAVLIPCSRCRRTREAELRLHLPLGSPVLVAAFVATTRNIV
eukprot:COSAG06_NODE_2048_length_7743_cov_19.099163_3_plen_446_part_00